MCDQVKVPQDLQQVKTTATSATQSIPYAQEIHNNWDALEVDSGYLEDSPDMGYSLT